ncbi:MAG: bifunctional ADP-dependent NAD(P)H-hydrate dehydratase/NAD(P)H-hydrate epimerase, partial [Actinomycetota bacterium]|nr:bifunctional ADP-dependent NAD(P)H-hydrate dehydratase/NAD(P)H-hydrate epimerase [Actinomycetota bacterium]
MLRREGLDARCFLIGDVDSVRGAAAYHLDLLRRIGGRVDAGSVDNLDDYDVIVDALFGTGFRGRAEGDAARAIEAMNAAAVPVVAVDIPSGLNGLTGTVDGPAARADVTVTFHAQKLGTALSPGAAYAGDVVVSDIGIGPHAAQALMTMAAEVARIVPPRPPDAHKRSAGSVALLAGSDAMSGAALLAARGALRGGAGYVTLGVTAGIK